jgi:hypothetical protein
MKNRLVIVTDLGTFKAFRLEENGLNSTPRLELIEEFDTIAGNTKLSDQTSDQQGRFPRNTGMPSISGDLSAGERHNIELENRRRLLKQIAERVNALAGPATIDGLLLAAPQEINKMFLGELQPEVRAKIDKNLPSNLTKLGKSHLLDHFQLK